ncbi:hypothetical protein CEUSTIGMA_g4368.t1 [Chlamydomonas eustigma]|uniref:MYND-type domain-containing protein n=1 Tax=Chlamydomonas eustigma TaxID=1157962 RepID=A0A250X1H0_9CHLO|nr:hypothetical protein CEUSTIGMA_g4368.t1 [Chlamydomonas eustigma]|eukprot:GAX76921.1 hypothetical protein CEUSTIGMA_g4368.t1 [Chlamydomonas eustigma]
MLEGKPVESWDPNGERNAHIQYSMGVGAKLPASFSPEIIQKYMALNQRTLGLECDVCGCSSTGSNNVKLAKCKQCLRKSYCSKECQKLDWVQGKHKMCCRPPKDFKAEDIIRAQGLESRPELNGSLLVVQCPSGTLDRWQVTMMGGDVTISMHKDKMRLIIPAEERLDM